MIRRKHPIKTGLRSFAALCAVALGCWSARAQYVAPYVNLQGVLTNASGLVVPNATLTFQPNTLFFVAGTATIVSSSQCATDSGGTIVGVGNPLMGPRLAPQYSGALPAGNYYVQFAWYDQLGNTTLPSPEVQVQLTAVGEIQVLPPVGNGPPQAVGMYVYIGVTPGGEQYQGLTTSTTAQFTQATALATGNPPPTRNNTPCRVIANDAVWPTGTGYNVSLVDASGNTLFAYPEMWQLLGPGSTYNLSQGIPYYNGQVTFPTPILTQPSNHNMQSINGSLSMGTPGGNQYNIVNIGELGVGTYLPAWGVDVEGSGAAGAVNAKSGYLFNGAAPLNHVLLGNGSYYVDSATIPASLFSGLYYQTVDANGVAQPQQPVLNFDSTISVTANSTDTSVGLPATGVTAGTYKSPTLTVDGQGRVTAATGGTVVPPVGSVDEISWSGGGPASVMLCSTAANQCGNAGMYQVSGVIVGNIPCTTGHTSFYWTAQMMSGFPIPTSGTYTINTVNTQQPVFYSFVQWLNGSQPITANFYQGILYGCTSGATVDFHLVVNRLE